MSKSRFQMPRRRIAPARILHTCLNPSSFYTKPSSSNCTLRTLELQSMWNEKHPWYARTLSQTKFSRCRFNQCRRPLHCNTTTRKERELGKTLRGLVQASMVIDPVLPSSDLAHPDPIDHLPKATLLIGNIVLYNRLSHPCITENIWKYNASGRQCSQGLPPLSG